MIIEVYRGDGLRVGAPIVEPLLSDEALVHRGRAEMDKNAHPLNSVEMDILFVPGLRTGQVISFSDPLSGKKALGKISGVSLKLDGSGLWCTVSAEVPR